MLSASCMSVKCTPNNIWVASCDSCELIIRLLVLSHLSLHYIKSSLSVCIISSVCVTQNKSKKLIWYITIMIYTWEQLSHLLWFKWEWIGKTCKYLYKYRLTNYRSSCNRMLYRSWKIPREAAALETHFTTVTEVFQFY